MGQWITPLPAEKRGVRVDTVDGSEIPRPTTVGMYETLKNNGISTTNLKWLAGFFSINKQYESKDRLNGPHQSRRLRNDGFQRRNQPRNR